MRQKVLILGAGVGGLTVAHMLAKFPDRYDVTVLERNDLVGGQARDRGTKEDPMHVSMYCWHAIGRGYRNLAALLSDIPHPDGTTVLHHLKPIQNYEYLSPRNVFVDDHLFLETFAETRKRVYAMYPVPTPWWRRMRDLWLGMKLKWILATACDERLEDLDDIKWTEYTAGFSPAMRRWMVDSTAILLGMDYQHISAHMMLQLLRHNVTSPFLASDSFFSFDAPMNQVWFDVWVQYLMTRGVHFRLNTNVVSVLSDQGKLWGVTVVDGDGMERTYRGDILINALPVEQLAKILPRTSYDRLALLGYQVQTQITYRLPYPMGESKGTVYTFADSPWFLMVRQEGALWGLTQCDTLSCGIGIWDTPGIIYHKSARRCTQAELAEECWMQMRQCAPGLFPSETLPQWDIWDTFDFARGQIQTSEPKFSNNIKTLGLRPFTCDDAFENLYHATAYTRTTTNLFNMESGVEAGLLVGAALGVCDAPQPAIETTWFQRWVRAIDRCWYRLWRKSYSYPA